MIRDLLAAIGAWVVICACLAGLGVWLSARSERRRRDRALTFALTLAEWYGAKALAEDRAQGKTYLLPKECAS